MMERFDLVFRGECLNGKTPEQVAAALQATFGLAPVKAAALFKGQEIIVKRGVHDELVRGYVQAFWDAGAVLRVYPSQIDS